MRALIEATPAWNQLLQQNVLEFGEFPEVMIDDVTIEFLKFHIGPNFPTCML